MAFIRKYYCLLWTFSLIKRFPPFIHFHRICHRLPVDLVLAVFFFVPALVYFVARKLICRTNVRTGVALAAIIKNEGPYILEFVEYYRVIGFSKVILYDNNSTDGLRDILQKVISSGFVEYHRFPGRERQKDAYNDALNRYSNKYKYMAFFDADEFLRINGFNAYDEISAEFSKVSMGCLSVNMFLFGTSGHIKKPEGLVIENYTFRQKNDYHANHHTKCIVDPKETLCLHNPHSAFLKKGWLSYLCNGQTPNWTKSEIVDDSHLILYHYYTRSLEEYEAKRAKGDALQSRNINRKSRLRTLHPVDELDNSAIEDKYLLKYVDQIKESIVKDETFASFLD